MYKRQDISDVGKRAGIHGRKSSLFFETIRLLREIRPRYALLENVAALLNRGMGDVCGTMVSSGYCVRWESIPAAFVGAPHPRDRVWILATNTDSNIGQQKYDKGKSLEIAVPQWDYSCGLDNATRRAREAKAVFCRVDDVMASRVDRLKALGNGQVPLVAATAWHLLAGV